MTAPSICSGRWARRQAPDCSRAPTSAPSTSASGDGAEAGKFTLTVTDAGIRDRLSRVLDRSLEIVRRRIDEIGTTEPIIQRQGVDRILVQVPGLQDPSRLKDLLGQTAKLQFRLLCDPEPADQRRRPAAGRLRGPAGPEAGQDQIYWSRPRAAPPSTARI